MARRPENRSGRANARAIAQGRAHLPASITNRAKAVRKDYLQRVLDGDIPRPPKRSKEGDSLAAAASKARWGKADPRYEGAFKDYWYHGKNADKELSSGDDDEDS